VITTDMAIVNETTDFLRDGGDAIFIGCCRLSHTGRVDERVEKRKGTVGEDREFRAFVGVPVGTAFIPRKHSSRVWADNDR